jgi:hypothetical protein
MADQQKVTQLIVQVEWIGPSYLKGSQIIAQVEYDESGGEPPAGDEPGLFFANG